MFYVRWRIGESRLTREFPAKGEEETSDHVRVSRCPVCVKPIGVHRPFWLLATRPGPDTDEDTWEKYNAKRWCTVAAVLVHSSCVEGLSWDDIEVIAQSIVFVPEAEMT